MMPKVNPHDTLNIWINKQTLNDTMLPVLNHRSIFFDVVNFLFICRLFVCKYFLFGTRVRGQGLSHSGEILYHLVFP